MTSDRCYMNHPMPVWDSLVPYAGLGTLKSSPTDLSPLASCNAATNADLKRSAFRSSKFLGCFRVRLSMNKQLVNLNLNSYYTMYNVQGKNLQNVNVMVKSDNENDSCYHLNPRIRTIHLYNCKSENAGLPPLWPFTAGVNADDMWAWVVLAFASVEHRAAST